MGLEVTMEKLDRRRGRRYELQPLRDIRNPDVAYAAALLDEARDRCIDLIVDMTHEAMWTRPAGSPFSAGDLVLHMNWAEYLWLPRIGPHRLNEDTVAMIQRGSVSKLYEPDSWTTPVQGLVELCRQTREQLMVPCLNAAVSLDQEVGSALPDGRGPHTVREIVMHLVTSWIYHSGQVGLLTLQNGLDYQWAFP
jgi:uncharacterized damage-inducible protein DinB